MDGRVNQDFGVTDDSVNRHIMVSDEQWIPAWQTIELTITSEYETSKVYDTTKVRSNVRKNEQL